MASPNPRITNEMWRMWTDRPDSTWKLGGIYADKPGYHNSRAANQKKWPNNYSIRLSLDKLGPSDKAAAIDYTMSDAKMRTNTARLRASALESRDNRLAAVREFYGTLDSNVVYGLIKDDRNGPWRASSSDSTHLWHIHISIFRAYVDDWQELEPILSVLSGETFAEWVTRKSGGTGKMLPKKGDGAANGMDEIVKYWQRRLHRLGFNPGAFDGEYGNQMQAAVTASRTAYGYGNPGATEITGTHAEEMDTNVAKLFAGVDGAPGPVGPAGPPGELPEIIAVSGTLAVNP